MAEMTYRRLGRSGLKVSTFSFGSWVSFGPQLDVGLAAECMAAAWDAGVNFFDNAEAYEAGKSEEIMGSVFQKEGWKRHEYVASTKLFWGIHDNVVNMKNTLNRKYLLQAMEGSLERMGLDFVDLVFCHRHDPDTPVEETVWAMHDIVDRGQALYWGTSEWPAERIRAAHDYAVAQGLRAPVMEQPQYNMLVRDRVETEYAPLYDHMGLGTTIWSPLASGLLTGKYLDGVPEGSRGALPGYEWLQKFLTDQQSNDRVRALADIAASLDASLAQMSLAWCAANENVSTVITGASRPSQVVENMGAIDVLERMTPEVLARIDEVLA